MRRAALIVVSFSVLAALIAWLTARYDGFGILPVVLFAVIVVIVQCVAVGSFFGVIILEERNVTEHCWTVRVAKLPGILGT